MHHSDVANCGEKTAIVTALPAQRESVAVPGGRGLWARLGQAGLLSENPASVTPRFKRAAPKAASPPVPAPKRDKVKRCGAWVGEGARRFKLTPRCGVQVCGCVCCVHKGVLT